MPTPAELLEQARACYQKANVEHRDGLLATGTMLHNFVFAYLQEGDSLSTEQRRKKDITRERAVLNAADSLRTTVTRISQLIASAMVVELMADNGEIGSLSHVVLRNFQPLIRRHVRDELLPISSLEQWEVVEPKAKHIALFRKAVKEKWTRKTCFKAVREAVGSAAPKPMARLSNGSPAPKIAAPILDDDESPEDIGKPPGPPMEILVKQVAVASPGDVAEMCIAMIEAAQEPHEVAIRLRVMLERFLPKKKRFVG